MLLSFPDEIILAIAQLLNLADARRLRRVSHRIFAVVATTRPKPLMLQFPPGIEEDELEAALDTQLPNELAPYPRGMLINVMSLNGSLLAPMGLLIRKLLCRYSAGLECLSITVSYVHSGDQNAHYLVSLLRLEQLHALTHLECVGMRLDNFPFKDLPALVYVSLSLHFIEKEDFHEYSETQLARIVASLAEHKLAAFTISAGNLPPAYVYHIIQQWPNLRSLNLWPGDMGHLVNTHILVSRRKKFFSEHLNDTTKANNTTLSQSLESLTLNFIPVLPSKEPRSCVPSGAKQLGAVRHFYTVYDTDIVSASLMFAKRCPSLNVVGWMVPISNRHCKRVWCRRKYDGCQTTWECVTDEDCWPETDMDVIFS